MGGLGKGCRDRELEFREGRREPEIFRNRGHRQLIAGYYDGPLANTRQWLGKTKDVPGVLGVMYTTWKSDYSQLEAFAKLLGEAGF